jgi:hypothetical protein
VESFGGRLRDELLAVEAFNTLLEARVLVQDWRIEYNTVRPHSALGYLTPTDYARTWTHHPPRTLIESGPTTGSDQCVLSDLVPRGAGKPGRPTHSRPGTAACLCRPLRRPGVLMAGDQARPEGSGPGPGWQRPHLRRPEDVAAARSQPNRCSGRSRL